MQVPGQSRNADVTLVLQVVDRDQDRVLDPSQPDQAGIAVAHRL